MDDIFYPNSEDFVCSKKRFPLELSYDTYQSTAHNSGPYFFDMNNGINNFHTYNNTYSRRPHYNNSRYNNRQHFSKNYKNNKYNSRKEIQNRPSSFVNNKTLVSKNLTTSKKDDVVQVDVIDLDLSDAETVCLEPLEDKVDEEALKSKQDKNGVETAAKNKSKVPEKNHEQNTNDIQIENKKNKDINGNKLQLSLIKENTKHKMNKPANDPKQVNSTVERKLKTILKKSVVPNKDKENPIEKPDKDKEHNATKSTKKQVERGNGHISKNKKHEEPKKTGSNSTEASSKHIDKTELPPAKRKTRSTSCCAQPNTFTNEEANKLNAELADLNNLKLDELMQNTEDLEVAQIMSHNKGSTKRRTKGKSCIPFGRAAVTPATLIRSKSLHAEDFLCFTPFRVTRSISGEWPLSPGIPLSGPKIFDDVDSKRRKPLQKAKRRQTIDVCEIPKKKPALFSEQTPYVKPAELDMDYVPRYQDESIENIAPQSVPGNITVIYGDPDKRDPRLKGPATKFNINGREYVTFDSYCKYLEKNSTADKEVILNPTDSRKFVSRKDDDPDYTPNQKISVSPRCNEYPTRSIVNSEKPSDVKVKCSSKQDKIARSKTPTCKSLDSSKIEKRPKAIVKRVNSKDKDMPVLLTSNPTNAKLVEPINSSNFVCSTVSEIEVTAPLVVETAQADTAVTTTEPPSTLCTANVHSTVLQQAENRKNSNTIPVITPTDNASAKNTQIDLDQVFTNLINCIVMIRTLGNVQTHTKLYLLSVPLLPKVQEAELTNFTTFFRRRCFYWAEIFRNICGKLSQEMCDVKVFVSILFEKILSYNPAIQFKDFLVWMKMLTEPAADETGNYLSALRTYTAQMINATATAQSITEIVSRTMTNASATPSDPVTHHQSVPVEGNTHQNQFPTTTRATLDTTSSGCSTPHMSSDQIDQLQSQIVKYRQLRFSQTNTPSPKNRIRVIKDASINATVAETLKRNRSVATKRSHQSRGEFRNLQQLAPAWPVSNSNAPRLALQSTARTFTSLSSNQCILNQCCTNEPVHTAPIPRNLPQPVPVNRKSHSINPSNPVRNASVLRNLYTFNNNLPQPITAPVNQKSCRINPSEPAHIASTPRNLPQPITVPVNQKSCYINPSKPAQTAPIPRNVPQPVTAPVHEKSRYNNPVEPARFTSTLEQLLTVLVNEKSCCINEPVQTASMPRNFSQPVTVPVNDKPPSDNTTVPAQYASIPRNFSQPVNEKPHYPREPAQTVPTLRNHSQPLTVPANERPQSGNACEPAQSACIPRNLPQPVAVPLNEKPHSNTRPRILKNPNTFPNTLQQSVCSIIDLTVVPYMEADSGDPVLNSRAEFVDLEKYFDLNPEQSLLVKAEEIACAEDNIPSLSTATEEDPIPRSYSNDSGLESPSEMDMSNSLYENRFCLCGTAAIYVCTCKAVMYCSKSCQGIDWINHRTSLEHRQFAE